MGSPLWPTLSYFFLENLESEIFEKMHDFYPKLYLRYVDDVFTVLDENLSCQLFLNL